MRDIRWLKTLEGQSLAFPGVGAIVAGKVATLADDDAAHAILAGLAKATASDDVAVTPVANVAPKAGGK